MPSAPLDRRDARHDRKGPFGIIGFTIVELMVIIAVLVIIATLAVPAWHLQKERQQFTRGAEKLASFLSLAQVESVMRDENMTLSFARSDADRWCVGLTTGIDPCDCRQRDARAHDVCQVDGERRVLDPASLGHPVILDAVRGDAVLTFDPAHGALTDPEDRAELDLISDRGQYSLSVLLGADGKVRVCSMNFATQVPGYKLCLGG